jgi:hypothetical protein
MFTKKDFEYLKSCIKNIDFIPCQKNPPKLLYKNIIPLQWKIDLDILCDYYKVKLYLTKDRLFNYFTGVYYGDEKQIFITSYNNNLNHKKIIKLFSHELAHHIQRMNGGNIWVSSLPFFYKCEYERQADRIAYFIYKKYFNHLYDFHHLEFSAYRKGYEKEALLDKYEVFIES